MRIIHTSDWHLGQNFYTKSRKNEHQSFLNWLLQQIEQHNVDALIVAGDIFDTGSPPSYAREMYNQFVVQLQKSDCTLVVLGGNHDSVSVLNETKQILAYLNTHVIASSLEQSHDQVVELADGSGNVGALLCAIPFLRPRDIVVSQSGDSSTDKRLAIADAIKDHYASVYQAAVERRKALGVDVPIIATGHLTALGVKQSESVRDIYIGTLEGFAADGFPPADYIALGHIHRPQIVAKQEHIRYCGSPIPLSFDELKSNKQVLLLNFEYSNSPEITSLEIPNFQPMATVTGSLTELETVLKKYAESEETVWLSIEVEIDDYLSDLQQRIQKMVEDLPVEVLQLKRSQSARRKALSQERNETLDELSPFDVFTKRIAQEVFETDEELARKARLEEKFIRIVAEVEEEKK
ncbi:Nuclease sbcCD subunit D [Vibrio nigripulchritudo SFn27]|uniref:Nuclease SbcCD subunit D n=1 Tax=Vibrio nigripulchritudo TaxID=28173 RepID=U4KIV4_9VIBR|nr:exonuclease subunit SbcD [Vibrio nigripulchritudo]CCN82227.1 Nuclease sbcCD subunit D [Vibrio nigripulchritudo BLFn1]CCN91330.1 Nuclease sbcCD subunit D [Vibrio nigripulchritudo SFn27]CCN93700.1 Nuclease sbcCD subunit D [Vibrio nigripulchritudo ENn2]CCO39853.1 Nuclease sbcCD subunit D [Vibrio nigripulchritudo SFn135]CCO52563.1 Nuclease sbcCD subunit D [Vibrio nigripulchritudo Wn13]